MTAAHDDETRPIGPVGDETQAFETFPDDDAATRRMPRQDLVDDARTQRIGAVRGPADGPTTQRIAMPAQRSIAGWLIALIIVVALGVGTAIGYTQSEGGDEGVVARALVTPGGGILDFDGGRLEIPAGALPTATAITVRKVGNENRVRLGPPDDPSSVVYEPGELDMYVFEPAGLNLQVPAKITLPRPADGTALLVDTPSGPRVVGANAEGDRLVIETSNFGFNEL